MRPIVTSLQVRLIDVYLVTRRSKMSPTTTAAFVLISMPGFARMYTKVLSLAELVQSTEERPRACNRQQNRDNTPAETVPSYWKRSVAIPLLDTVCAELQSRFSEEKRAHFELCALIPAVLTVKTSEEISEVSKSTSSKRATEDSSCITDRQHRGGEVVLLCEKNPHVVKEQDDHRQAVGSSRDCHALPQCPYRSGQSIQQVHGNPPKAHDVSFSAP
ncbi:hypothetical protein OS493_017398 [Desmophyllum pertusum]|uniref:Uncharacterized protein n=1 Tax=Desmophyllum pertusum TaxID=174260 RepID=A0A9X0A1E6_9CNID|nr:hypothetical protein OS493_017398 [Desmophyllum pertusum]